MFLNFREHSFDVCDSKLLKRNMVLVLDKRRGMVLEITKNDHN